MDGVLTCKTYRLKKCYHYEHSWKETLSATHVGVYDVVYDVIKTCASKLKVSLSHPKCGSIINTVVVW